VRDYRCILASLLFVPALQILLVSLLCAGEKGAVHTSTRRKQSIVVTQRDFHEWKAIVLHNRAAEAVIVPDIGRIMQFDLIDRKRGHARGPFWSNPAIDRLKPDTEGWVNYGGDKSWPSPQAQWERIAGRAWPPPKAFDALPYRASIKVDKVELLSAADSDYGIRVRRTISLDAEKPVMTIETAYEKVEGAPIRVGIWIITQLVPPDRAFILLPEHSALQEGYTSFLPVLPKDFKIDGRLLSLARASENKSLIGTEGKALLWVGDGPDLLIEDITPPPASGPEEWPDRGSHAKIYTNSDELKYIELELLDRLYYLKNGERATMRVVYTLIPRTEADPIREAKKVFSLR